MRPLGKTQKRLLQLLKERHGWHPGCGWYWDSRTGTERVLDSLVRRGLAKTEPWGRAKRYTAIETPTGDDA